MLLDLFCILGATRKVCMSFFGGGNALGEPVRSDDVSEAGSADGLNLEHARDDLLEAAGEEAGGVMLLMLLPEDFGSVVVDPGVVAVRT